MSLRTLRTQFHQGLYRASRSGLPDAVLERLHRELSSCDKHLCQIASDAGLLEAGGEEDLHLRRHWYDPDSPDLYWPDHPVAEIVRHAYRRLIEIYRERKRPVLAVWLEGIHEVAVQIVQSDELIVAVVMTPPRPPKSAAAPGPGWDNPDEMIGVYDGVVTSNHGASK